MRRTPVALCHIHLIDRECGGFDIIVFGRRVVQLRLNPPNRTRFSSRKRSHPRTSKNYSTINHFGGGMVPQFLMVEKFARFLLVVLGRCVGTENNKQNLNRNRNSKEKNCNFRFGELFRFFSIISWQPLRVPSLKVSRLCWCETE